MNNETPPDCGSHIDCAWGCPGCPRASERFQASLGKPTLQIPPLKLERVTVPVPETKTMDKAIGKKIGNQIVGALAGVLVVAAAKNGIPLDEGTATGVVLAVYGAVYKVLDQIF